MPTLKATFKLYDNYTSAAERIIRKTDQATKAFVDAGKGADGFGKKTEEAGKKAEKAAGGLGKFISAAAMLGAAVKGMNIADTYVNTAARLSLINDGLQTQAELQDKIFASADRSRGKYSEMADAVAKMGLLAGQSFGSNDELIAFTELSQKSFKLGGTDKATQQGAMRQLTQAMASGRLQGDELVSVREGAPLIYQAIEKYMGKSSLEMKKLASDGAITADIIKKAMFMAGDDIESMFETLPMTFADVGNKLSKQALKSFGPVIEKINNLINTDSFASYLNMALVGIDMLAGGFGWLIDVTAEYGEVTMPILAAIGGYMLSNMIAKLWAMIAPLVIQGGLWGMLTSPIFLVILFIGLVAAALNDVGITTEQVFGFIGGSIGVLIALFANMGIAVLNAFAVIDVVIRNTFNAALKIVLEVINTIIAGLNKIPGVNLTPFDTSGIPNHAESKTLDYVSFSDAYAKGASMGTGLYNKGTSKISSLGAGYDYSKLGSLGTAGNPMSVKGTGSGGKVDVKMDDDDLQYLRDIAERDYINKFSTATLAPNIEIKFGDVHEEADADKVAGRLRRILQEEIALASEGVY